MRATFASATFVLALALAVPFAPSVAADLEGDRYAAPPYDDREGYADDPYDNDAPPPRRYSEAPADRYDDGYGSGEPPPYRGSIKDGYPVPVPAPAEPERRWEHSGRYEPPPVHPGPRYACLETWQIRRQLRQSGWVDIRPMGAVADMVRVEARRIDTGRVFRLRVERCSGNVLAARPAYLRSFVFRDRPWGY